jgi:hypothetical protein
MSGRVKGSPPLKLGHKEMVIVELGRHPVPAWNKRIVNFCEPGSR